MLKSISYWTIMKDPLYSIHGDPSHPTRDQVCQTTHLKFYKMTSGSKNVHNCAESMSQLIALEYPLFHMRGVLLILLATKCAKQPTGS